MSEARYTEQLERQLDRALAELKTTRAQLATAQAAIRDARGYAALVKDRPTLHNSGTLSSIIDALDRALPLAGAASREKDERDQIIRDLSLFLNTVSKHLPEDKRKAVGDYMNRKGLCSLLRAEGDQR